VAAFPKVMYEIAAKRAAAAAPQGAGALPLAPPPFDAALQHIATDGAHKVCVIMPSGRSKF